MAIIACERDGQDKLFINPGLVATVQQAGPYGVAIRFVGEDEPVYVTGSADRIVTAMNAAIKASASK